MMSSYYDITSTSPTLSSRMRGLGVENTKVEKNLNKELSRIETERKNRLRELNHATKHFIDTKTRHSSARSRECSPDTSSVTSLPPNALGGNSTGQRPHSRTPSPIPRSPLDDLRPLSPRSQKTIYRKSSSTDSEGMPSPRHLSPSSSPESQKRIVPKGNENSTKLQKFHSIIDTNTTHAVSLPLSPNAKDTSPLPKSARSKLTRVNSNTTRIPTIVVSDATSRPKLPPIKVNEGSSNELKKSNSPLPKKYLPIKSNGDSKNGSLQVPPRRCRSNSVPNITPPYHLLAMANKEPNSAKKEELEPLSKIRDRSYSVCAPYFDHLKNAPRRYSLLQKYIAKPKAFYRTSRTIERLISDLAKGICHGELDEPIAHYKTITPEEWEKLKLCRYLRTPGKDEDLKGNTINVDEIFT